LMHRAMSAGEACHCPDCEGVLMPLPVENEP
jgi:hypothetical protein